jgi:hypothetical protein
LTIVAFADKLLKRLQTKARRRPHGIDPVETRADAGEAFDSFVATCEAKHPEATECLVKDRDSSGPMGVGAVCRQMRLTGGATNRREPSERSNRHPACRPLRSGRFFMDTGMRHVSNGAPGESGDVPGDEGNPDPENPDHLHMTGDGTGRLRRNLLSFPTSVILDSDAEGDSDELEPKKPP